MVIVNQTDSQTAIVSIYATIGDWDFCAESFKQLMTSLQAQGVTDLTIMLHCYGGSVFDGNVMTNELRNSPLQPDVVVVGVCCSMASIFLQGAKAGGRKMVSNGFIMVHAPSGYTEGNVAAHESSIVLLNAMEKQFAIDYGAHSGASTEDTAALLDGNDHWFDAESALAAGLIDEIIPSIITAPEVLTVDAVAKLGAKAAYAQYTAVLEAATKPPAKILKSKMDKKHLVEKYKLEGVTAESSDEDVQAALEKHFDAVQEKANTGDTAEVTLDKAINAIVAGAVGPKITAKEVPHFVAIGKKAGIETLTAVLGAIKPHQTFSSRLGDGGGGSGGADAKAKEGWDWDKYQKEDSKGLEALEKTNPEAFGALYQAKYGRNPFTN